MRFCYNARGSLEEVLSHLTIAHEVGFISDELYKELAAEADEIDKMLNGYISYLKKSKQGSNEPGSNTSVDEQVHADTTEANEETDLSLSNL